MVCAECGANACKGYTTVVTDLGNCLVIVRNVPCYKCTECNEVIYTADVIERLEEIVEQARKLLQEIAIIDYTAWQREYFDRMAPGQVMEEAAEYARKHPYQGTGKKI